jgi:hypothetical protein
MFEMRRAVAITLALPPLLYSGAAFISGWFATFMQCDEICRSDSADWRYTRDAWQWYFLGGLGAAAFLAGLLFFVLVVQGRPRHALAFLVLGTTAVVVGLAGFAVDPGSDQDLGLELPFFVVSAAVFVSGVVASFVAVSRAA